MPHSYEHSLFEKKSSILYSLINPDDHSRLLTDPAFRLQKTKEA